jgi:hypothetical protein
MRLPVKPDTTHKPGIFVSMGKSEVTIEFMENNGNKTKSQKTSQLYLLQKANRAGGYVYGNQGQISNVYRGF